MSLNWVWFEHLYASTELNDAWREPKFLNADRSQLLMPAAASPLRGVLP